MKLARQELGITAAGTEEESSDLGEFAFRPGNARTINLCMSGPTTWSASFNFSMPDDVVAILKRYRAIFDKKKREWTANLTRY